ncbi:hypothetical protein PVK06_035016 [Gossypium arboreum]|uniref:Uncharacterized protein n=1 Tax=Gossypium arboreum TaxID=29729 RepID=A0ABR0NFR2_GOSAR|nr:hypothetical protein PVK06_035016 [Gossypium arboreum]
MAPKEIPRTSASSSYQPSGPSSSFNECFRTDAFHERFDKNFASKRVWESRKVDIAMLEAFFSNAKLEHDKSNDTVIANTSFLTNTPIRLTLEELGDYLHLPFEGYHFDATSSTWVKSDHLMENEDEDVEGTFEDIIAPEHVPSLKHAPPPASSSLAAKPSPEINGAILDVVHSLSNVD